MTLHFRQGADAYDITIARGALSQAGELFKLDRKVLVVTGEGVPPQYADTLLSQCPEGFLLTVPEGEANKTLASVELILEALLEHGFTRGDAVVAVGGGVVGDTAGFAAACYMRGIDWYNVPTTLLSQADSSVGGKTGVNLHGVKNIVGAFRQPAGVLIDPDTLDTLSPRLFSEGLAEIIKMAATSDAELFRLLESADDIRPIMEVVLAAALCIKIAVVEADPTEHGLRAVLNFGHTIGHALEGAAAGCKSADSTPGMTEMEQSGCKNGQITPATTVTEAQRADSISSASAAEDSGMGPLAPVSVSTLGHVRGRGPQAQRSGRDEPAERAKISGAMAPTGAEGGKLYHGEAVAIGMLYMAEGEARERIERVLQKYGLPTQDTFDTEVLMHFALHDKKKRQGKIKIVKVSQIGSFRFEEAGEDELRAIIQARKI